MTVESRLEPIPLSFGPPQLEEFNTLGRILQEAFEISGKAVFGDCNREEVLPFRVSILHHKDQLRQLYEQGKIETCHRLMVARNSNTNQVVGLAIWSIEDDWTPEGIIKRKQEDKLACPTASLPKGTNIPLWEKVWKTFDKMQQQHLRDLPRCREFSRSSFHFQKSHVLTDDSFP